MAQTLAMPLALSFSVNCYGGKPIRSSSKVSFPVSTTPKHRGLTIRCARVGGIEIPNNKRIEASLQYIHGIGRTIARQILNDLNYENKLTYNLSEEELVIIRDEVAKYRTEGDLRRFNAMSIKRLKDIRCYRGVRHTKGLPCRGQRTKNNCRTLKGKRVAVPGKKKTTR